MAAALCSRCAMGFNPTASLSFNAKAHEWSDPGNPTELALQVFCSYSEVAFPGEMRRHNLGCGSGMTCWRRYAMAHAGIWD